MISWVLVLTLIDFRTSAIHSVSGFASQAECLSAGNAWTAQVRTALPQGPYARAMCMQVKS